TTGKISVKNISKIPAAGKKPLGGIALTFSHELTGNPSSGDLTLSRGELELNGLQFILSGKITGWKSAVFHAEAIKLDAEKIIGALPTGVIGVRDGVSAKGSFSFTLDGTVTTGTPKPVFSYTGKMAIENMSISVKGFPKKIDRFQSFIAFTEKELTLRDTQIKASGSDMNLSGLISNYLEKPVIALKSSGNIRIDDLADALPTFRKSGLKGGVSFDLSASGTPSLPKSMEMNGNIALKGLSLPASKVMKNPMIMNGSLRLSPREISLENLTVQTGKSDFSLNGRVSDYMNLLPSKEPQPAVLKGALTSRLIDINDMIFIDKNTPTIKPWDLEKPIKNLPVPPSLQAEASLALNTVAFGKLKADSVKGRLILKNGILELNGLEVSAYDGKLTGNTIINFSHIENVQYNGGYELKKLNAQTFISSFFGAGDNFRGLVSSSLTFSGAGLDSVSFLNNLKGSGSATIENGQFVNWDFTKKFGQKLQFLNFDTLSFDNAYTTFNFEKQKVFTPAILFKTQYGDITVSGSTGYDTTVNYDIIFKLNGTAATLATKNKLGDIGSLLSSGTVPQLYLTATGKLKSPSFQIDTSRTKKEVQDRLKNEAEKLLNKQDDKLRQQGKKILDKLFR
ncbi:MAG: AsmA-like C-terminal region-containing protein, partial [Candidatus Latescibacterota bacterium]